MTGTVLTRVAIPLIVYASVPGGQDVPMGAYTDSVLATVNF
jgi:spore coat protein U-like protein